MNSKSANKSPVVVVVDEGSSQCKVAWYDNGKKVVTNVTSSLVKTGRGIQTEDRVLALSIGGIDFHASTEGLPNNNEDFQVSPQNIFAVHNALIESGFAGQDIHICVTLPIAQYFSASSRSGQVKNDALIKAKEDNLLNIKPVALHGDTVANIVKVSVHCEGKPALYSTMLDDDLQSIVEFDETDTFVIVDIGDTTTDIAQFNGTGSLLNGGFASISQGVSNIRQVLHDELNAKHGKVSGTVAAKALRNGKARIGGEDKDIKALVTNLKAEEFHALITEVSHCLKDKNSIAQIIVVGGGAAVYRSQLTAWDRKVSIPENNETALAEGILRLEMMRLENK